MTKEEKHGYKRGYYNLNNPSQYYKSGILTVVRNDAPILLDPQIPTDLELIRCQTNGEIISQEEVERLKKARKKTEAGKA